MRTRIEFMYLDLETCTRCRGTDRNLEAALEAASESLAEIGAEVDVDRIHVTSAEQARELRLVSSPTLRVNGRDVALELRESSCGSEACTDGDGRSIACRVWVHEGREHTEAPVALIVDAVLREASGGPAVADEREPATYEMPEDLERYFAGRAGAGADAEAEPAADAPCCSAAEQRTCCAPEDKAGCCGTATAGSCGCR